MRLYDAKITIIINNKLKRIHSCKQQNNYWYV